MPHDEPPSLDGLEVRLDATTEALAALRKSVDAESVAHGRTINKWEQRIQASDNAAVEAKRAADVAKTSMKVAAFVACIALIAAILGLSSSNTANDAVDQLRDQRTASRITQCVADNDTAAKINNGNAAKESVLSATREVQAEIHGLLAPIETAAPSDDPVRAKALADFIATAQASSLKVADKLNTAEAKIVDAQVAARDCSPAAVERYYATTTTSPP